MHLKMSSAKWRLYGLGLNELSHAPGIIYATDLWPYLDLCWVIVIMDPWERIQLNDI